MLKTRVREVYLSQSKGIFSIFKREESNPKFDFESLAALRKILSNEKAKIILIIKEKKPDSVYEISKILGRDFKNVKEDIDLLVRFGILEILEESDGKRKRHKPILATENLNIILKF